MTRQYTGYCSHCTVNSTDIRELIQTTRNGNPVVKCLHCNTITPLKKIEKNSSYYYLDLESAYHETERRIQPEGTGNGDTKVEETDGSLNYIYGNPV